MSRQKEILFVDNCILDYRLDRGWSRKQLAILIGSTEKTIEALESNLFCPSIYLALCLAVVFDCHVEDLFTLEYFL